MLINQSILQAALLQERGSPRSASIFHHIQILDLIIRDHLTEKSPVKEEYNSECPTEAPSEDSQAESKINGSIETIEFTQYIRQQRKKRREQKTIEKFEREFNKSTLFVKYIKTRNKQHFREVRR